MEWVNLLLKRKLNYNESSSVSPWWLKQGDKSWRYAWKISWIFRWKSEKYTTVSLFIPVCCDWGIPKIDRGVLHVKKEMLCLCTIVTYWRWLIYVRNGRAVEVICFQADQKIKLTKITTNLYFNYRVANSFTTATPTFNKNPA